MVRGGSKAGPLAGGRGGCRWGWTCALVAVLPALACGPIVASAPFSSRPETLEAGDLLGPFDGMVIDGETERPLADVLISASWAFERGLGAVAPAGHHTVTLLTTPDGRYELPRLPKLPGGASSRVARFTMVVYRRGYTGWRSDQSFPVSGARKDFSQRRNVVRMSRWREGVSHAHHLAFLGGSPAIQSAAAWERQPAALELRTPAEGEPSPPTAPALLDASPLLQEADVRALNGYAAPLRRDRLTDLPRSEFYDSVHFQAETAPTERDDVAIRLWRLGEAAAETQYRTLVAELPEPEARREVGDASVRVSAGEVRAMVFLVRELGLVVSVTCGQGQCPDADTLVRLATLVHERLPQIPIAASSEPQSEVMDPFAPQNDQVAPEETKPEKEKPEEAKPEETNPEEANP